VIVCLRAWGCGDKVSLPGLIFATFENGRVDMDCTQIDILELLPQKPPFVMVDLLLSITQQVSVTRLTLKEDNLFCENGELCDTGLMENVAQSCAARIGYVNKIIEGDTVKIGVIGAIRDFVVEELPKVGEVIDTEIVVLEEVFNMTLVEAKVRIEDRVVASCKMKISLTDIDGE